MTIVERYAELFADRTRVMKSSAMRDVMSLAARSEVISLAGGLADTTTFGSEEFAHVMNVVARNSARALQYSPTEGLPEVIEPIVAAMAAEDTPVDPDDVMITTGGQQALDLACKTFVNPGDVVVAEGPTYPGAAQVFTAYEADVVHIDLDADGMDVDLLEERLAALEREGRRPKLIYTVPTFQNPGGVSMSLERRHRLVALARERELLVLEDNPYGQLRYDGDPLPTLYSLDTGGDNVIYLGTFSKTLSPGARLGWIVGPRPVVQKFNVGKQAADLCSSSLSQLFVVEYVRTGRWPAYLERMRELYAHRRDVMLEALEEFFPAGSSWNKPGGGMFVWATLPEGIDTTDLLAKALSRNVAFVPGRAAFLDGRGQTSMRLSYATVPDDELREGVRRIGEVACSQLELLDAFAPRAPRAPAAAESAGRENVVPWRARRSA